MDRCLCAERERERGKEHSVKRIKCRAQHLSRNILLHMLIRIYSNHRHQRNTKGISILAVCDKHKRPTKTTTTTTMNVRTNERTTSNEKNDSHTTQQHQHQQLTRRYENGNNVRASIETNPIRRTLPLNL